MRKSAGESVHSADGEAWDTISGHKASLKTSHHRSPGGLRH